MASFVLSLLRQWLEALSERLHLKRVGQVSMVRAKQNIPVLGVVFAKECTEAIWCLSE